MKNFSLLLIALLLIVPIGAVGFIYALFKRRLGYYFWLLALSIDQLGNAVCMHLFNDLLIKPDGHRFGNPNETVSHVLGKNKETDTLYLLGRILSDVLGWIDQNHVEKAANRPQ